MFFQNGLTGEGVVREFSVTTSQMSVPACFEEQEEKRRTQRKARPVAEDSLGCLSLRGLDLPYPLVLDSRSLTKSKSTPPVPGSFETGQAWGDWSLYTDSPLRALTPAQDERETERDRERFRVYRV